MIIGACLLFIILVIIIIIGIFWWLSYWAIFYPSKDMVWNPTDDHYQYNDVYLPVNSNSICEKNYNIDSISTGKGEYVNIWHFDKLSKCRRGHTSTTVLFFHGNTGNISHRKYMVEICKRFGLNLVLVDCRGYGQSNGEVCPEGMYIDGEIAYHYLQKKVPANEIIVWGESLGGTIACHVASKFECRCLILMATFSSLEDVIIRSGFNQWLSIAMSKMVRWLFHPMESKEYLKEIKCPVAIVHSREDTLIPYECSQILYESIPHERKMLFTINGDHATPNFSDSSLRSILAFLGIQGECLQKDVNFIVEHLRTFCQEEGLLPG